MSYSITPILREYKDKKGLQAIQLRVIIDRKKVYFKTGLKVKKEQFLEGVIKHPSAEKMNAVIRRQITAMEDKILEAMKQGDVDIKSLANTDDKKTTGKILFTDYVASLCESLREKYSPGRLRNYMVVAGKLDLFKPDIHLQEITVNLLEEFEKYLHTQLKNGANTIHSNMQVVKAILNYAAKPKTGLIKKDQFDSYKKPSYVQTMPTWLTEPEIKSLSDLLKTVKQPMHLLAGNYFLLSCFTGYRLSDCRAFDYSRMVHDGKITLRAEKNGTIVSIPIHKRLKPVLAYCKDHPLTLSEDKTRKYVKDLCRLAGINKQVKFHSGRHSFAMLLMAKGFTIDEVAKMIGDTPLIAKVYARVHNVVLDEKVRKALG